MGAPLDVENSGFPLLDELLAASESFFMRTFFGGDVLLEGVFFWLMAAAKDFDRDFTTSCAGTHILSEDLTGVSL